jgi:hypothetical protein
LHDGNYGDPSHFDPFAIVLYGAANQRHQLYFKCLLSQPTHALFNFHNAEHEAFFDILTSVCEQELDALPANEQTEHFISSCMQLNYELARPPNQPILNALLFHVIHRQTAFRAWVNNPQLLSPTQFKRGSLQSYYEQAAVFFFRLAMAEMTGNLGWKAELLDQLATYLVYVIKFEV